MKEVVDDKLRRLIAPWGFHFDFVTGLPALGGPGADEDAGVDVPRAGPPPGCRATEAGGAEKAGVPPTGALAATAAQTDPTAAGAVNDGEAGGREDACAAARRRDRRKERKADRKGSSFAKGFLLRAGGGVDAPAPEGGAVACPGAGGRPEPKASASSAGQAKRKKLPPGYYWTTSPQKYEFAAERDLRIEQWRGVEQVGEIEKPIRTSTCRFYRIPGLAPRQDIEKILAHCKQSKAYKIEPDSVDQTPTFEYYPFRDGEWADPGMRPILEGVIEGRVLPYIRERYGCRFCAVADILVRRYIPGERRTHAVHFDGHAFVTAVLGLSSPDDYEGGLYLQPEPDIASRMFFRVEPGDLIVHSFDLQHGVHVWKGVRHSLIFWIKDSLQAVRERSTPWFDKLAERDDPDGLYNIAQNYEYGMFGKPKDIGKAIELYERSAAAGHHFAQNNLGLIYKRAHENAGLSGGLQKSFEWLKTAAETGFAMAQKNLALAYANGQGVKRDDTQATIWMRRAAEQLEVEAAYMMGEMYRQGRGVPVDGGEAAKWYERSAEAGFPKAQYTLGMLCLEGTGLEKDLRKAEMWLRFAAKQGDAEAKNNLATMHAQRGEIEHAAEIWSELAKRGEPNAQCNIGMCFMRGAGRERDLGEARKWLAKAAKQGHQMAAQALVQLGAAA